MKKKYRITKRFVILLVVLALVVTLVPAAVLAQDAPTMESAAVTVDAIPEGMDVIPVPFGTMQDAIPFPLLTAGGVSLDSVTWEAETYDAQQPGGYVFTAALPEGYMPPDGQADISVTVTVAEPQGTAGETIQANDETPSPVPEETVTGQPSQPPNGIAPSVPETAPVVVSAFDEIEPAAYEIAVGGGLPALPEMLKAADADGETIAIEGVIWEADNFDANTPGEYVFTAKLPEGYAAAPEAEAPQITVTVAELPLAASAFGAEETVTVISVSLGEDKWNNPVYYDVDEIHSVADLGLPGSIVGWDEKNQRIEIAGVTWECAAFNADALGTYTFQLALPAGYTAAGETTTITVVLYNEFAADGLQYWTLTEAPERTAALAGWAGAPQASLKVPAAVSNGGSSYRVTEVVPQAFENDGAIKNLDLSGADNLTEIGAFAFAYCRATNPLTIPANVVRIGNYAFAGGYFFALNLQGAARLTTIGICAFSGLQIKGTVTIPGGVTSIGSFAFESCESLEVLDLSAFRGTLGESVFEGCRKLSAVIFGQAEAPKLPDGTFKDVGWSGGSIHCPKGATGYEKVLGLFPGGWSLDYLDIHTVTVNSAVGGTGWIASGAAGGAGNIVSLGARPQSGYDFVRWDTEPAVTWINGTNQYDAGPQFSMPDRDVVVTPVFSSLYSLSGTVSANGSPVRSGLQVTAYNAAGKRVGSAATNADGKYIFSGLTAGTYQVTVMGVTIGDIPYYQTTREFELTDRDKADADVALETGVTQVGFVSAKANGTQNLDTSTQIDLRFDVPVPLTKNCVVLNFNDGGAADVLRLVDEGQLKTDWVLEIGNVVTAANKGYAWGSVTVALPQGYQFTSGALGNLKLINLCRQLEPPAITAASYDTAVPVVGGAITVTPGIYTANEAGAEGSHRYAWYRSDRETGLGTPVARTKDYTPTGEDFGKYIWVETTPQGEVTDFWGRPVASPRLQVGVKLTVAVTGAAGGTSPTIDGTAAGSGVVVYGPATVSFTKTAAGDTVRWTASPNEGSFDDDAAATAIYTPAAQPSTGTIALTATLTNTGGATAPGAPTGLQATPGDRKVDLTWTAPESDGGSAITGYQFKTGNGDWADTGSKDTNCTVTGLDNGIEYTFMVRAVNAAGAGKASGEIKATPALKKGDQDAPAAPTVQAKTATSVTLNTIPGAEYRLGNGEWKDMALFENLTPNTTYTFYARLKETATYNPSPASNGATITTEKATLTGVVTLTGTHTYGQTLTANTTSLSSNPVVPLGALSYKWTRDNVEITGATGASYKLTADDIGAKINVTVTAVNCIGSVTSANAAAVEKAAGPPAPTVTGSYTGNGTSFTYTITAIDGAEYSNDGTTWQPDNEFTGYHVGDTATFYARMVETKTHEAGKAGNTGEVPFIMLDQAAPTLAYTIEGAFPKTVTITAIPGAEYSFNGSPYGAGNTYISNAAEDVMLGIRLKETATHNASPAATLTVNTKDQDQPAPAPFELAYTANGETDYTVRIPEIAGTEYSFDGTTFSAERSKTGCKPGETVTGYARLAAKPGYNAGAVTSASVTLPLLDVHTPTISPSGGTFTGAQSVTLSCTTAGADIYYTLDGNTPNAGSTRYTGTFTLTKTATVKAIAVKAGMADSVVASASFTRATDDLTLVDLTKDATFTLNGDFALIGRVLLDGKEMGQVNKTPTSADLTWAGYPGNAGKLEKGSVIVTLYKEFLKTLPEGRHTLTLEFNDAGGAVSTGDLQFAVPKQQEPKPTATGGGSAKTGDESNMALWIVLVCVAGFAIAGIVVYRKRKYRNQ